MGFEGMKLCGVREKPYPQGKMTMVCLGVQAESPTMRLWVHHHTKTSSQDLDK